MIYVSHLLDDSEMADVIEKTGAGVETIEFSISENLDHLSPHIRSYRQRLSAMGCEHLSIHGPFLDLNEASYDSLIQETVRKRFEQAYSAAVALNAEKIVYHTGFIPSVYYLEGWAERMAEFWIKFMDSERPVPVMLENVWDPYAYVLKEIAEMVNHPAFKLCLDIGHAHCYSKETPGKWVNTFGDTIGHMHVHDNRGRSDEHLALGDGTICVSEVFMALSHVLEKPSYTAECRTASDALQTISTLKKYFLETF